MSRDNKNRDVGGSSLISRFAASTALLAAAIIVLAFFSFHAIQGDIFRDAFETPMEEWSVHMASRIGDDAAIAQRAARTHQMGILLEVGKSTFAFGADGEPTTAENLEENSSAGRKIVAIGHNGTRYSYYFGQDVLSYEYPSLLWLLIGGLLFLIGVVYVVQLSQLRPLRWLKEGVQQVAQGNLSSRVPVVRMDEIGQVGQAFNHMTERLQQMLNDQDRLLADVSHELRSPISRIKVALEMLPDGDKKDSIAHDIREMESLTTALLEREKLKHQTVRPNFEALDMVNMCQSLVDAYSSGSPRVIMGGSDKKLIVQADQALMRMLIQNLLDNAVKFSMADSGPVELLLNSDDRNIRLQVIDDGCGIPADMTEKVMDAFVKLDPSRGHHKGYGLGLNLCQRIIKSHKGKIEIHPRKPRGTVVTATIPLNIAAES